MGAFQLWVNLPAAKKMMDPRYQELAADAIPTVRGDGAKVRVIAGEHGGVSGPVTGIVAGPTCLDVTLEPGAAFEHLTDWAVRAFAYVHAGTAAFGTGGSATENAHVVRLGPGDVVRARAGPDGARFLLVAGRPIGEPVTWRGPIVMNTDEDLCEAFRDLSAGTFVGKQGQVRAGAGMGAGRWPVLRAGPATRPGQATVEQWAGGGGEEGCGESGGV